MPQTAPQAKEPARRYTYSAEATRPADEVQNAARSSADAVAEDPAEDLVNQINLMCALLLISVSRVAS